MWLHITFNANVLMYQEAVMWIRIYLGLWIWIHRYEIKKAGFNQQFFCGFFVGSNIFQVANL